MLCTYLCLAYACMYMLGIGLSLKCNIQLDNTDIVRTNAKQ